MLWPDYCLGAAIVREDRWGHYVLERCFEFDVPWVDEVLLMTNSPEWALTLIKFFTSKKWLGLRKLVDVVISDLVLLRGTHSAKDRCIARLRKLVRILEDTYVRPDVWVTDVGSLLGLDKLREYIEVLEAFRNEYHRVRDKVHELLYPHLRSELERIKDVKLWFSSTEWHYHGLGLLITFNDEVSAELELKRPRRTKYLSLGEAVDILRKIVERKERRRKEQKLENDEWAQLKLLEPIPKVIERGQARTREA